MDPSYAERTLRWGAKEQIESGLAKTIDWYLANREWLLSGKVLGRLGSRRAGICRSRTMKTWKGVILAGGTGSRLAPLTRAVNKHLLPVFDKPMIYYPLTTLMLAGVQDIIIVTTSEAVDQFLALLGDGSQWGLRLRYRVQDRPAGIADGLLVAAADLKNHDVVLILGDNIFFGAGLAGILKVYWTAIKAPPFSPIKSPIPATSAW